MVKGPNVAKARGVLMMKKLKKKCTLSILVSNLFLDRQRPFYVSLDILTKYISFSSWNSSFNFKKRRKNRLDTKESYGLYN